MAVSFEPVFVEKLSEDNTCAICFTFLIEPVHTRHCEHYFCKECFKKWLEKNPTCPACRASGIDFIQSPSKKQQMDNLSVYCPNCSETMCFSDCFKHLATECLFMEVECDKKCGKKIFRKDLQYHLNNECSHREVKCEYCKKRQMRKDIKKHFKQCPSYPVPVLTTVDRRKLSVGTLKIIKRTVPLSL